MNTAQRVREHKERHPELYCFKCLWKIQTERGPNPCKRHPVRTEPTHISQTIDDVLLAVDTPEEIREDAAGWTHPTEQEDVGFPVVQYTDDDIDQMEQEQRNRALTED